MYKRLIRYIFIGAGGTLLLLRCVLMIQRYSAEESDWYIPITIELQGWLILLISGIIIVGIFIIIRVITKFKRKLKERERKKEEKRQEENEIEIRRAY